VGPYADLRFGILGMTRFMNWSKSEVMRITSGWDRSVPRRPRHDHREEQLTARTASMR
jgi:hypothetical protein